MYTDFEVPTLSGGSQALRMWGPADARVSVVLSHGTPGSRIAIPEHLAGVCAEFDVSIIASDRPGYGESTRAPYMTIGAWAKETAAAIAPLVSGTIASVGWSGGGLYAAAIAAELGADRLVLVSSPTGSFMRRAAARGNPAERAPLITAMDEARDVAAKELGPLALDPCSALIDARIRHPDDWILESGDTRVRLFYQAGIVRAFMQGADGLVDDFVRLTAAWEFDLSNVTSKVTLFHGTSDPEIPPQQVARWQSDLEGAAAIDAHAWLSGGHFDMFRPERWAEVIEAAAAA